MLEEVIHPFQKRHIASRRSREVGNTLFEQFTATERVTQAVGSQLKRFYQASLEGVGKRGNVMMEVFE
jgi:hypothetical protein